MEIGLLVFLFIVAIAMIALSATEAVSLYKEWKGIKKQLNNKNHE